jgi:hypothetical protein
MQATHSSRECRSPDRLGVVLGLGPVARKWCHSGKRRLPRTVLYRVSQAGAELVDLIPGSLDDLTCSLATIKAVQDSADIPK